MEKITLTRPIKINGEERTEFDYDLAELSCDDVDAAEKAATPVDRANYYPIAFSRMLGFMAIITANPGVTFEDLNRMSAKDALRLTKEVGAFLDA